jgi:hypothetical protein
LLPLSSLPLLVEQDSEQRSCLLLLELELRSCLLPLKPYSIAEVRGTYDSFVDTFLAKLNDCEFSTLQCRSAPGPPGSGEHFTAITHDIFPQTLGASAH